MDYKEDVNFWGKTMQKKTLYALIPAAVFLISFIAYLLTLAPSIYWGDSAELSAVAYTLGIAHPSGYPLYTMLGKLFTYLPVGDIAYRTNLMSAFFASFAVMLLYFITFKISKSRLASLFASLTLAFSYTFWSQAVITEVYTLNAFFVTLLLLLLLKWDETNERKYLYYFCLAFGLGLTNHLTLGLLLPAFIYFILTNKGKKEIFRIKTLIPMALLFFAGLIPYLYLPLRAMQNPALNWGNPSSFASLWAYIFSGGYGSYFIPSSAFLHLKFALIFLLSQFPLILIFSVGGIFALRRNKRFLFFMLLIVLFNIWYNVLYSIPDIRVYFIPTFIIFSLLIGSGIGHVLSSVRNRFALSQASLYVLAFIMLALLLSNILFFIGKPHVIAAENVVSNSLFKQMYPLTVNHHNFHNAEKYVDFIMDYAQKDAIILAQFDEASFPLLYTQRVEGKRKDIILLFEGLLTSQPWYEQQIKERYPQLNLIFYNKAGVNHIDLTPPSALYTLTDNPLFVSEFNASLLQEYSGPRLFMTEHSAPPSALLEFPGFKTVPIPV